MCTASIWHMCTMSMDRYFTLKYPMRYGRNKTKMMVALKIFFVWAVSITISSPICIFGIKDTSSVFNDGACVPTITDFVIYGSVFAFYIPLMIMLITYVLTIRILWRNQNMMRNIDRSDFRSAKYAVNCGIRTLLSPPSNEGSGKASYGNSETDASTLATTQAAQSKVSSPMDHSCNTDRKSNSRLNSPIQKLHTTEIGRSKEENQLTPGAQSFELGKKTSNKVARPQTIFNHTDYSDNTEPQSYDSTKALTPKQSSSDTFCEIDTPFRITVYGSSNSSLASENRKNSKALDIKASSMTCLKSSSEFGEERIYSEKPKMNFLSPKADNFLRVNSNETLTLRNEKPILQSAASFCTVPQTKSITQRRPVNHCHSCSDIDKRDFKFTEWKQHYYQIQREMDQILKDSERERKLRPSPTESTSQSKGPPRRRSQSSSCYLSIDSPHSPANSDTGDSMDDLDDSSSSNSDLLTIKLRPTSLHMYKVGINKDQATSPLLGKCLKAVSKSNGNCHTMNEISDYNSDVQSQISRTKPSSKSIRHLLKRFNKAQGLSQIMSKRTTTNEKKASKVLGIIFAVFVILWTPFFTVNIMSVTCSNCMSNVTTEMMSVFLWMGYIASLANPIIYTMFNTAFRRAFIKILKCHLCKNGSLRGESTVMSYAISANGFYYGSNHKSGEHRRNTMVQLFRES